MSAFDRITQGLNEKVAADVPAVTSFMEFLRDHAWAKTPGGDYVRYSFVGREALLPIVEVFDLVLGSHTGVPLPDATIDICGGAQFGKTILALNFGAYLTACRSMNWGYFLPTQDLVEGVVDMKLRPDVIEQIPWLQPMMQLGVGEGKNGKKVVNRKGAFQVTNGSRKAFGFVRGMDKPPTTFSADVVMEDEKDDIKARNSKFLTGRMTASDLRLKSSIGTQRLHSAGQQKQWEDGSQGIFVFDVGGGRQINLEENWPAVCRMAVDGTPKPTDPKLTKSGNFQADAPEGEEGEVWPYEPGATYYLADPETGTVIDRSKPILKYLRPERVKLRKWSFRVSQFVIAALSVDQFVSRWQDAVADPDSMVVFRCDVMADPANTEQALSPEILKRARTTGQPFDLSLAPTGLPRFAGLDTGNRCWFASREIHSEEEKRIVWAEQIPLSKVVERTTVLFHKLEIDCLAIDANPAVDQARALCYRLNGIEDMPEDMWAHFNRALAAGRQPGEDPARLVFPGGLVWDDKLKRWEGLRCFVVEFTLKPGGGTVHKLGIDEQNGFAKYVPTIQTNRFDSINRVINEFLTPEENVIRTVAGRLLEMPVMRLPRNEQGSPPIVATFDAHLLTGSKRQKAEGDEAKDFVGRCENHLVLANAYSAMAEMIGGHGIKAAPFGYESVERLAPEFRRKGGGL